MEFIKEHFDEQLEAQAKEPGMFAEAYTDAPARTIAAAVGASAKARQNIFSVMNTFARSFPLIY